MRVTGLVTAFDKNTGAIEVLCFGGDTYNFTLTGKALATAIERDLQEGKGVSFKI